MNSKTKVLVLGPGHPYRGGISDTTESMARAFQRGGCEVTIATYTALYPEFLFPGKTQFTPDPKPADLRIERRIHTWNPLTWPGTINWMNGLEPDLVLTRFWIPFLGPSLGTLLRGIRKPALRIGIPDNIKPHETRMGDLALTRYFVQANDGFITLSKTVLEELREFTDKPARSELHPINDHLAPAISRQEARKRLGLDPDGRYLLFFGLIRHYKGLDLLLRAMAETSVQHLNIKLLVTGEFYEPEEEYRSLISELGLEDRVIVRNEFIPTAEMPDHFGAADLVAQPYRTASQSGIIPVAYHYDRPVLVTDVGGLGEFVETDRTGLIAAPQPAELAQAIVRFYENPEVFCHGIPEMKEALSWDRFAERVIEFTRTNVPNR